MTSTCNWNGLTGFLEVTVQHRRQNSANVTGLGRTWARYRCCNNSITDQVLLQICSLLKMKVIFPPLDMWLNRNGLDMKLS